MWQDYVIAATQWFFAIALLPTVFHKDNKPTFVTSATTFVMLIILAITFGTLGLWSGTVSVFAVSMIWFALAYQRYKINKRKNVPLIQRPLWIETFYNLAGW